MQEPSLEEDGEGLEEGEFKEREEGELSQESSLEALPPDKIQVHTTDGVILMDKEKWPDLSLRDLSGKFIPKV